MTLSMQVTCERCLKLVSKRGLGSHAGSLVCDAARSQTQAKSAGLEPCQGFHKVIQRSCVDVHEVDEYSRGGHGRRAQILKRLWAPKWTIAIARLKMLSVKDRIEIIDKMALDGDEKALHRAVVVAPDSETMKELLDLGTPVCTDTCRLGLRRLALALKDIMPAFWRPDDVRGDRCGACLGYGRFDDDGRPSSDGRDRRCMNCNGTGHTLKR